MRILKLGTKSENYTNVFMLWAKDIVNIRSGNYDAVSWYDRTDTVFPSIPINAVLSLLDAGAFRNEVLGTKKWKAINYDYIRASLVISKSSLRVASQELIPSTKTAGVSYEIIADFNGVKILRHGLSKSTPLKKTFATVAQAKNYIRTQLREQL